MNQALRHLWDRAYQLPANPIEQDWPRRGRVSSGKVVSSRVGFGKPRILVALPKSKPVNRNDKIRQGLEHAYPGQWKGILDQAYGAYYATNPQSPNLPELYELNESGFLDMGIEACGLHSWVIGRSK